MDYVIHLLVYFNIYLILALSLNLIAGYLGRLTLAHAGYYALGAYVYAIFNIKYGCDILLSVLIVMIFVGILSLFASLPSFKFKEDVYVMITLVIQVSIINVINNWSNSDSDLGTLRNMTNGPYGIFGIPRPKIFSFSIDTIAEMFLLTSVFSLLSILIFFRLMNSPWGRLVKSIRDDEIAVANLGKNLNLIKFEVICIGSVFAGIAGALYAAYVRYIDPSMASLDESILMLSMVIVGGVGNIRGPLLGAFILLAIPEFLRLVNFPESIAANARLFIYGLLLIVIVHFRPNGLLGIYRYR